MKTTSAQVSAPNPSTPEATRNCTFERVIRECDHNKTLTRKGLTRGLLYDFKALLDGQHVAWWSQYSPNGGTDTSGFRYWLRDKLWDPINSGEGRDRHPVAARNREEFESVLLANLNRIPTDGELAQRKLEQERKEAARRAAEDAANKLRRMELAAPDMLAALKAMVADDAFVYLCQGIGHEPEWLKSARLAISKAESGQ